jgi:LacI family transcriptional regulator
LKWYNQHRPDAVLGFPDACDWLREEGIRVPGECEIALINIEDGDKNSIGVNHHMRELGAAVMDLVIEQLNANQTGVPAVPKVTLVECAWRPSSK